MFLFPDMSKRISDYFEHFEDGKIWTGTCDAELKRNRETSRNQLNILLMQTHCQVEKRVEAVEARLIMKDTERRPRVNALLSMNQDFFIKSQRGCKVVLQTAWHCTTVRHCAPDRLKNSRQIWTDYDGLRAVRR